MHSLNRLTALLCGLFIWVMLCQSTAFAQQPSSEEGSDAPQISLVTFGPGPEIWARFGHNAIRVQQGSYDVLYNFGYFDLDEPGFLTNYALGNMQYYAVPEQTSDAFVWYRQLGRSIREQRLRVSDSEANDIAEELYRLVQPDSRRYRYDYFFNNCSTRVRDVLDAVLGYPLQNAGSVEPAQHSMRWEALRMVQDDWLLYLGLHIALGRLVDQPISIYEQAFLPEHLASLINQEIPASVISDTETSAGLSAPGSYKPRYLGLGVFGIINALLILIPVFGKRHFMYFLPVRVWLVLSGLAGSLLGFLWLATAHEAAWNNENLLLLLPANLFLVRLGGARLERAAAYLIPAAVIIALIVKLLPGAQFNSDLLLWFIPAQLSAFFVWWSLHKRA